MRYHKQKLRKQFTTTLKGIKYQGLYLNKEVKVLHSENHKTLMKEIKHTNKWKDILCPRIRKMPLKCSYYPK